MEDRKCMAAQDYLNDEHLRPEVKEFLKALNAGPATESLGIEGARKSLADAQSSVNVDYSGIYEEEKWIATEDFEIKINITRPDGVKDKKPAFLFLHGGGWVLGDYPTHRRLVRDLVVTSGYPAIFVNYTPSPEAQFPKPVNEIYEVLKWVAKNGDEINVDGSRLAVVGNSAGGNMTLATGLMAKANNGPEIKLLNMMWPVTDISTDFRSYRKYGKDRFLTQSLMEWMFSYYSSDPANDDNIYLSPLRASLDQLRGLPPVFIQVAENDILRDGGEAMGRKLAEAGVHCATLRFNGTIHDWGLLNGLAGTPEVEALILSSAAYLRKYLG